MGSRSIACSSVLGDGTMVINVGAFTDRAVYETLCDMASVREETLKRCYAIEGYADLPLEEKNRIYDEVKEEVLLWKE